MYAAKFKLKTTALVLKKAGYLLNKPLVINKKKDSTIPPILYGKYNQIPYKNKINTYLQESLLYNYYLKLGYIVKLIQRIK
jgi:hypothetical protein